MCNNHCRKLITYSCGNIVRFGYKSIMYPLVPCPFNTVPSDLTPENNRMALQWKISKTTHQNNFVSFQYTCTMLVVLSKVYHFSVHVSKPARKCYENREDMNRQPPVQKKETKFVRYCFSCNLDKTSGSKSKKSDMIHGTDSNRVLGVPKHSGGATRNSVGACSWQHRKVWYICMVCNRNTPWIDRNIRA